MKELLEKFPELEWKGDDNLQKTDITIRGERYGTISVRRIESGYVAEGDIHTLSYDFVETHKGKTAIAAFRQLGWHISHLKSHIHAVGKIFSELVRDEKFYPELADLREKTGKTFKLGYDEDTNKACFEYEDSVVKISVGQNHTGGYTGFLRSKSAEDSFDLDIWQHCDTAFEAYKAVMTECEFTLRRVEHSVAEMRAWMKEGSLK